MEVLERFGYLGIALMMAVENIFPPIPSEVILTFGGFMTTHTELDVWLVSLWATVGSLVGTMALYGIGRFLNEERLERWLSGRWGKILHLKAEDVKKADAWFRRKGQYTVLFCRFIPIVRSLISIPAGMARMPLGKFLLLSTVGTAIWNTLLAWLGAVAGEAWSAINHYLDIYSWVAIGIMGVAVLIFGYWFYKKRISQKKDDIPKAD